MLTKVSIVLFYLRVFPYDGFRLAGQTVLGFVVLSSMISFFCVTFQCLPVQYNWDKDIHNAKCLDVNTLTYAHAGISVAQDVMILLLPIPWIIPLQLRRIQKIGMVIMFQAGAFACITAIVRLRFLTQFGGTNSTDPLWDTSHATMWSAAEVNSAIICSCLPAMRALWKTSREVYSNQSQPDSAKKRRRGFSPSWYGQGMNFFASKLETPQPPLHEEHDLDRTQSWVQNKDADRYYRSQHPLMITQRDLGSSENDDKNNRKAKKKSAYLPDLKEEPDLERNYSRASDRISVRTDSHSRAASPRIF